jgi:hypothetical protein
VERLDKVCRETARRTLAVVMAMYGNDVGIASTYYLDKPILYIRHRLQKPEKSKLKQVTRKAIHLVLCGILTTSETALKIYKYI